MVGIESIVGFLGQVTDLSKKIGLDPFHTILITLVLWYFVQNMASLRKTISQESTETKKKKENFKKSLPVHIKRHSMIQMLLEKIVFDLKGTKAYVFQYHNGGESVFGIPFAKLSMTNEFCPVGIERELTVYQNLPLSVWSGLSLIANKEGCITIHDVDKVLDGSAVGFFRSRNVKSAYVESITDLEGNPIGLIVFESVHHLPLSVEATEHFRCMCSKICGLIMCKDISMDECDSKECSYNAEERT